MSETVIFGIGIAVFALTIWGVVMAGGYWFGEIAKRESDQAESGMGSPPPPRESSPSP